MNRVKKTKVKSTTRTKRRISQESDGACDEPNDISVNRESINDGHCGTDSDSAMPSPECADGTPSTKKDAHSSTKRKTKTSSTQNSKHPVSIHWFRNRLRFHHIPSLLDACQNSFTILPLYIIDPDAPFAQSSGRRTGAIRANFILESIHEMNDKLWRQYDSKLVIVLGKPIHVLPQIIQQNTVKTESTASMSEVSINSSEYISPNLGTAMASYSKSSTSTYANTNANTTSNASALKQNRHHTHSHPHHPWSQSLVNHDMDERLKLPTIELDDSSYKSPSANNDIRKHNTFAVHNPSPSSLSTRLDMGAVAAQHSHVYNIPPITHGSPYNEYARSIVVANPDTSYNGKDAQQTAHVHSLSASTKESDTNSFFFTTGPRIHNDDLNDQGGSCCNLDRPPPDRHSNGGLLNRTRSCRSHSWSCISRHGI